MIDKKKFLGAYWTWFKTFMMFSGVTLIFVYMVMSTGENIVRENEAFNIVPYVLTAAFVCVFVPLLLALLYSYKFDEPEKQKFIHKETRSDLTKKSN